VLHTAALGGSGPAMAGQVVVHGSWLMLHLPTLGQLTRSCPGVVHAWSVIEH
jgi:hypothetical protein